MPMPRSRPSSRRQPPSGTKRDCLVIAHRGDSSRCPENTLSAFASAHAAGADGIELDVRLCADGIPVVCHDPTLARFHAGRARLALRTLAELRSLSVGSWFAPRFAAERLPTLLEVLTRFPSLTVFIELKPQTGRSLTAQAANRRLVDAVIATVAEARAARRVALLCFDPRILALSARRAPHLRRIRNHERPVDAPRPWLDRQPGIAGICFDQRVLTPALVAAARQRGLAVFAYTCNEQAVLTRLRRLALDGLLTDRPAWLTKRLAL